VLGFVPPAYNPSARTWLRSAWKFYYRHQFPRVQELILIASTAPGTAQVPGWPHREDHRSVRTEERQAGVFASGWIEGDQGYLVGRTNIILARIGSILVADDWAGAIYRISYSKK